MQYLYEEADSFMFMDTTTTTRWASRSSTVGESADYHAREHQRRGAVLQRRAPSASTLPNFIEQPVVETDPASAATPRPAPPSRSRSHGRHASTCRCSSASATSSRSTRAPASTSSASAAPRQAPVAARRARPWKRAPASCAPSARWFEGQGFLEVETPARVARPGRRPTSTPSPAEATSRAG